jgi:hypothetical protein
MIINFNAGVKYSNLDAYEIMKSLTYQCHDAIKCISQDMRYEVPQDIRNKFNNHHISFRCIQEQAHRQKLPLYL